VLDRFRARLEQSWLHPRHIAHKYLKAGIENASVYARGRLLDAGCGRRPYEAIFRARVEAYVGLDWPGKLDGAMADIIGDAMQLPFRDLAFDTVLATEVLEHLPMPELFLQEVARVLADDGTLIVTVPFMEPLHEEPRDYYRFTPYSVSSSLKRYGFDVVHIWQRGGWWSVCVGSFLSQLLYSTIKPANGRLRLGGSIGSALVLPMCCVAQLVAYGLDRAFKTSKYALGYTAVARRRRSLETC